MDSIFVDVIIPVRPYLKKYVAHYAGAEPFHIKLTKCHVSAIFMEALKKERVKCGTKEKKHLSDQLTLRMSSTVMREAKFWWDEETIMIIDHRLKSMFDQQLIDYITMRNQSKGDIKQSIADFMEYYQMTEDDISMDTLIKMYYRARFGVPSVKREKMEQVMQLNLDLFQ